MSNVEKQPIKNDEELQSAEMTGQKKKQNFFSRVKTKYRNKQIERLKKEELSEEENKKVEEKIEEANKEINDKSKAKKKKILNIFILFSTLFLLLES